VCVCMCVCACVCVHVCRAYMMVKTRLRQWDLVQSLRSSTDLPTSQCVSSSPPHREYATAAVFMACTASILSLCTTIWVRVCHGREYHYETSCMCVCTLTHGCIILPACVYNSTSLHIFQLFMSYVFNTYFCGMIFVEGHLDMLGICVDITIDSRFVFMLK